MVSEGIQRLSRSSKVISKSLFSLKSKPNSESEVNAYECMGRYCLRGKKKASMDEIGGFSTSTKESFIHKSDSYSAAANRSAMVVG